jgi:hypothetical protein
MPSLLDVGKVRKWSGTKVQGAFCYWCRRYQAVRQAFLNSATFKSEIETNATMAADSKIGAFAYITLRLDGRTHVTIDMLETRVKMLRLGAGIIQSSSASGFKQFILLDDLHRTHPQLNPVSMSKPILQLFVNGRRRLGVEMLCPRDASTLWPSTLPCEVVMSPDVRTEVESDWTLLISYTQEAEKQRAAMAEMSARAVVKQEDLDDELPTDAVGGPNEEERAEGSRATPSRFP